MKLQFAARRPALFTQISFHNKVNRSGCTVKSDHFQILQKFGGSGDFRAVVYSLKRNAFFLLRIVNTLYDIARDGGEEFGKWGKGFERRSE